MNNQPSTNTTDLSTAASPEIDWILDYKKVMAITGFSRASIYRLIAEGQFPAPTKIGHRKVGWKTSQINNWLEQRFGPGGKGK
jgi:prophage regulatory protein